MSLFRENAAGGNQNLVDTKQDPFDSYIKYLKRRQSEMAVALSSYRQELQKCSHSPDMADKIWRNTMQPLMMTEEDDLFFKLLPFHQRDFAKKVFDELQTALLKNELTTSREDITLKVIRQSMDQIKLEQDSILSTQRKTTVGKKGVISTEIHSQLEEEILNEVLSQVKKKNRLHRGNKKTAINRSESASLPESKQPRKSIAQQKFEEYMAERERSLQEELNKKFKANPVPESSRSRRCQSADSALASNKALVGEQVQQPSSSGPVSQSGPKRTKQRPPTGESSLDHPYLSQTSPEELRKMQFKAKPIPHEVLHPNLTTKEALELRLQRIKERAQQLLTESALPSRMADGRDQEKGPDGRQKKKCRCPADTSCTFRPAIRHDIPDFKKLQEEFASALALKRARLRHRRKSVPFVLSGSNQLPSCEMDILQARRQSIAAQKLAHQLKISGSKEESIQKEKDKSRKADKVTLPEPRDTHSAKLKRDQIKKQREEKQRQASSEMEQRSERIKREKRIAQKIKLALFVQDKEFNRKQEHSKTNKKEVLKKATADYMNQLKEMYKKLDEQPCMFERLEIEVARRRSEAIYKNTLMKHGLSAEEVKAKALSVSEAST